MNYMLSLPCNHKKLLLHSCCAPCSCGILSMLKESCIDFSVFFYNPNIVPETEYLKRKDENKRFSDKLGIPFIDADYNTDYWEQNITGLENEPEKGKRCSICFYLRMKCTADFANKNGFDTISSSLGISRWKNFDQVTSCGKKAASEFPGIIYWEQNWRKNGGVEMMAAFSKSENFYRQNFCGCRYSRVE